MAGMASGRLGARNRCTTNSSGLFVQFSMRKGECTVSTYDKRQLLGRAMLMVIPPLQMGQGTILVTMSQQYKTAQDKTVGSYAVLRYPAISILIETYF